MLIEYGLLHVLLILVKVYYLGVFPAIITLIGGFYLLSKILDKMGYQFAVGSDVVFFYDDEKAATNCIACIEVEKINADTLKNECFFKKGITNVRKMRQIPKKFLGVYFWKDVSAESALDQFEIIDDKFEEEHDVIKYCNSWAQSKISTKKPQWQIKFKEDHTESTSLLMIKCHHSFTDGVGAITLFAFLNDESFCPKMMPKPKQISLFSSLMVSLFTPIALIFQYCVVLFHKTKATKNIIHTPNRTLSGDSIFLKTKTYDFKDIRKCYKQFENTTFNHYVMGVLSKSIHSWYGKNDIQDPGSLIMSCPVSMKSLPKSVNEINLNNYTSSVTIEFPVLGQLKEAMGVCKKRFGEYYKLHYLMSTINFQLLFRFIPFGIGKMLYHRFLGKVDFLLTNVCGPKEPIYLCNKKILRITPFLNNFSNIDLIIVCFSYNERVSFQIIADKTIQMDPNDLKEFIETNLDNKVMKLKNEFI